MMSGKSDKQTRYLSQALQLEEAVCPHIITATMTIVSLSIVVFLIWAGFTNIHEVARTPGEVVPNGYQQTVQHLEGGIVKVIHIQDGDVVKEGQILITLSDSGIKEDLERARSKQLSLEMQAERFRAFIEGREPDFSPFTNIPERMIDDQILFFKGMRNAIKKEEQVIKDQISQKTQAIESLMADQETAQKSLRIIADIYQRRATLNKEGYASDIQLLESERQMNDAKGKIKLLKNEILVSRAEIEEFSARLESLTAGHRNETHEKLDQILAEIDQNIKTIQKFEERIMRLEVRAPVYGLVKGLAVNTVGSVIQSGQNIMEVVPLDKQLEVQVKISPKDIGHLAEGQSVQVKFSTYDFSKYGSVQGRLERISATTFTGQGNERYYQGFVVLDRNYVGSDPHNMVVPGMTVMADVITGKKTILQYLLKPVQVAAQTAFTER